MKQGQDGDRAYIIVLSIFIGSLTIASVLASKIIMIFGLFVPAGVLAYSITFICTDTISEIWGKKKAQNTVIGGFIALGFVFVLVQLGLVWPSAPFWNQSESFQAILGSTSRIIIASFIAYLISQYHDVWAFHFWKKVTKDKHLWLRNNLSTAVSQFLDSFIFVAIAFYGVMPIWPLILGQWVVKIMIAGIDTPVIYFVVWLLKKKVGLKSEVESSLSAS
jgi:queuosine precursor transporter